MQPRYLLLTALLYTSVSGIAQQDSVQNKTNQPDWIKDIIKINLTSLPLKNISMQYEYVLSRKISLAFGGRMMPTTSIPFKQAIIDAVADGDNDTEDIINKSRLGNIAITPEIRFYLGRGYGRGFYVAPYYRYVSFTTNTVTVNYSETNGPQKSVNLNGELSAHTGGILLGVQKFLGKHIILDWWILGAHYGAGNGSFIGIPSTPFTPGEQADVKQALDDIEIPLVEKTVTVTANNVAVKMNGPFGGLRAGILFGIRF